MELLTCTETAQKMGLIRASTDAVLRARELAERVPCARNVLMYQRAKRDRDELRSTLPPLRVVQ